MTYPAFLRTPVDGSMELRWTCPPAPVIGIFWDMENCPIPADVHSDGVASNIRSALKGHPAVEGFVTIFSAYGDFNHFSRRLREGCQRTGVNLIDVPNGRKDASDKAILVDMFLFALDNPPPCTILLISGDVDFAPALHKLGQRGYTVLLAVRAATAVASSLCNASQYVWDWPSAARGEGLVPAKALVHCHMDTNHLKDEDPCACRAPHTSVPDGISRANHECSVPMTMQSSAHARGMQANVASVAEDTANELWAPPRDIDGLKNQLIKLLKIHGGMLNFTRLSREYKKLYERPLSLSEYGSRQLGILLKKMQGNDLKIVSAGWKKMLVLQDSGPPARQRRNVVGEGACHKDLKQQGEMYGHMKEEDDMMEEIILLRAKEDRTSCE